MVLSATLTQPVVQAEDTAAAPPALRNPSPPRVLNSVAREGSFLGQRLTDGQPIPNDAYDRALEQWRKLPQALRQKTGGSGLKTPKGFVSAIKGTVWTPIGPSPVLQSGIGANGRVSSIALNPFNPNVIYQGAEGGGVWRSTDGGATWAPLLDQQPSLGIGEPSSIAIDPQNTDTIYVGTSGRFVLNISKGILKSTDAGGSWIVLGSGYPSDNVGNAQLLFSGQNISSIQVDPANSGVIYIAADSGVFRSTDGGRNWTAGTGGSGIAQSLALDGTTSAANRILYAGINGAGIIRSTDGGQTWAQVLNASTPAVAAVLAGGGIGRVLVALAPPTSPPNAAGIQVLYATMEGTGSAPDPVGLFESQDQGATWTQKTATGMPGNSQGGFSIALGVDPASPGDGASDILYFGAVGYAKSTDSGSSFSAIGSGMHPDFHSDWVFAKQPSPTPSIVFAGNDGGIWKSIDGGGSWSGTGGSAPPTINAGGLQTELFYNLGIKQDASASVTEGSLQDNGTVRTTGGAAWTDTIGGDGWDFAFETANNNNAYHSGGFYSSPSCTRVFSSTDSGSSWPTAISDGNIPPAELDCSIYAGLQVHGVNVDPNNTGVVYVSGANSLFQTTDGGSTFKNLKNFGNRVGEVSVAPSDSNTAAVGVRNQVFVTQNALGATPTFTDITRNLPGRDVTRVAVDPNDPTVVYATVTGFGSGHVVRTTIGGSTWTDISPPVNIPCNAIALDGTTTPTTIYVGTDLGVMRSVDGGASWATLDDLHLPNVPVTDIALNLQAGVMRVATFGRGAFEFAAASGPVIAVNPQNGLSFGNGCVGSPERLTLQVFNVGSADLVINSVQRLMGSTDFSVLPNPATPLVISPNAEVDFTVQYNPTAAGPQQATIRVASTDPAAPFVDLTATGFGTNATIATVIADSGNFGNVCVGSFADLNLGINNSGGCDLVVKSISFSLPGQFLTPGVVSFPLIAHPGDSLTIPIRFQPTSLGAKNSLVFVSSNDPLTPVSTLSVSGNAPPGKVAITGSASFGTVCAGAQAQSTISVCNVGACNLHVLSAAFNPPCPDFTLVNNPFPATVSPDFCLNLTIAFTPTSCGSKSCTLVIQTDDPTNPTVSLTVTGTTPCASIDVPPDLCFPPEVIQSVGPCSTALPFPISNKGNCPLTITSIAISGGNAGDFGLSGLPSFPILLQPGHEVGEGDLNVVCAPTAIARSRTATLTVTYISDPVTGATTSISRALSGEGVRTGARVLVTSGGVPVPVVDKIQLQRINANRNKFPIDSNDVVQNAQLVTVVPAFPCQPFQYQREYGTVSHPIQLLPGSYQVTVSVTINGKKSSQTVGFSVNTCDFDQNIVVNF